MRFQKRFHISWNRCRV